MIVLKGKFGDCKIFTDNADTNALEQVKALLNNSISLNSNIRIMPDIHMGAGISPIGLTMNITDKVIPYCIGVDIGCGMLVQTLKDSHIELGKLDKVIHANVPAGFSIHKKAHRWANDTRINELRCVKEISDTAEIIEQAKLNILELYEIID